MDYFPSWQRKGWVLHLENWKQIPTKDEYQKPDTTKGIIRGHCQGIERNYLDVFTGLYTVEEKQRKEKLYKDYKDLRQRVLNEAGKTDWNRVEEMLEGILNEMRGIYNRDVPGRIKDVPGRIKGEGLWKFDENIRVIEVPFWLTGGVDELPLNREDLKEQIRKIDDLFEKYKGMKIKAETLEGEVVTVKNVTPYDLVRDVKDQIATRLGRKNPDEIILLHQQEEMKDTDILVSYEITDGTTINVLPRVRGKGLLDNAKYAWDQAKNMMKRLAAWIPGLFADTTREVTKQELGKISHLIGNGWEILGQTLGIDEVKLDHIKSDNKTMAMQILKMLTTWVNDIESEATVGKLYKAMEECSSLTFDKKKIKLVLSGAPADL